MISPRQGSAMLENPDPWPSVATDLQLGFIAAGGDNSWGLRLMALGV